MENESIDLEMYYHGGILHLPTEMVTRLAQRVAHLEKRVDAMLELREELSQHEINISELTTILQRCRKANIIATDIEDMASATQEHANGYGFVGFKIKHGKARKQINHTLEERSMPSPHSRANRNNGTNSL